MGFRKQGKGGIYFKETEEVSANFEGNKQTQKMLGKWNTGKQIFDFWGTSKFISDKQNLIFKVTIPPPTGPPSAVGNVSGYRCEVDCRSRGREFDPGLVPYFRGD